MNTQFPVSVRVIPMAAFAAAAIVAGVLKEWTSAAWMALPFVLFAAWPTRMAFTYRAVSRATSVGGCQASLQWRTGLRSLQAGGHE